MRSDKDDVLISTFWDNVRSRCKELGITQGQLSCMVGDNEVVVRNACARNTEVGFGKANKIALALHTTVDALIGNEELPTTPLPQTLNNASGIDNLAQYISICMAKKGFNQSSLAKKLDRNSTALSAKFSAHDFKMSFIQEVADALDANIHLVFTDKETGVPIV